MPCPPADPLPADRADEIVNDIAGNLIPPWFPTDAVVTVRRDSRDPDRGVLYVATRPFDVRVAAPAPLDVVLTLDPGPCLVLDSRRGPLHTTAEHVTITVRVGDVVTDTWTLGRTRIDTPTGRLSLATPGGWLAFDRQYSAGTETYRTLVEVPALNNWMIVVPELTARLGPGASGAAQAALRTTAEGDVALAGARLVAGPGAAGAHVWVDGLDLGALDGPLAAPVGGVVRVRWEGATFGGGVEAGLGPGVTLELAVDGTARVVEAPPGRACATNTGDTELRVCERPWGTKSAFDLTTHTCSPDGLLEVSGVVNGRSDGSRTRAIYVAMPGDYRFAADTDTLRVALTPHEGRTCTPRGIREPTWTRDIEGRSLTPLREDHGAMFAAAPVLAPLVEQDIADVNVVVVDKALTLKTDLGLEVHIGHDGRLSEYDLEWSWRTPESARLRGAMAVPEVAGMVLQNGELSVDGAVADLNGGPWFPSGRLCDGTQIVNTSAVGSWVNRSGMWGFLQSPGPTGARPGEGSHTVRQFGFDRDTRTYWFEVQPWRRWPASVAGMPEADWVFWLEGDPAVVRCRIE